MLSQAERQAIYKRALEQMRAAEQTLSRDEVAELKHFREARCASCNDPDSDPVYDGAGGMVCDLCGEDWKGKLR